MNVANINQHRNRFNTADQVRYWLGVNNLAITAISPVDSKGVNTAVQLAIGLLLLPVQWRRKAVEHVAKHNVALLLGHINNCEIHVPVPCKRDLNELIKTWLGAPNA